MNMPQQLICRNTDLAYRNIQGHGAIMQLSDSGEVIYHGLNEVGARIWDLADGTRSLADIVKVLVKEFEVAEEDALRDSLGFIQELTRKGLLKSSYTMGAAK